MVFVFFIDLLFLLWPCFLVDADRSDNLFQFSGNLAFFVSFFIYKANYSQPNGVATEPQTFLLFLFSIFCSLFSFFLAFFIGFAHL
jgi:hypothetical protein